jgi:hypothetical protein
MIKDWAACHVVTELQQALEALGQLPADEQRQIAQRVLEAIAQR